MSQHADISVIIPSYNGAHKLPVCLANLQQQTLTGFEVVVVLDGSTDNSLEVLKSFEQSDVFRLKVIETPNGGRSVARNNGAKNATSAFLLFLDDDMEVTTTLVRQHLEEQQKSNNTVVVGNNFRDPEKASIPFHQFVLSLERSWESGLIQDGPIAIDRYFFSSQNFSVPAELFTSLGGFDEHLRDAEDFDLGLRALNAGVQLVYRSAFKAFHNDWPDLESYIRRHNQYVAANQELARLRPQYLERFPSLVVQPSTIRKRRILSWCRRLICPLVLRNGLLFRLLPQRLQFILYRMTIAAYSTTNSLNYSA